ncbi:MAG: hypothetical protein U1D30_12935 [Planctomycetota bacterium]
MSRRREVYASYDVGDRIRIRDGASHPVYPDINLSGWVGTVRKYDRLTKAYLIVWSKETLQGSPGEYGEQCNQDALDPGTTWIDAADLEYA